MKIASYNCNSVRARMPVLKKWLDIEKPDILCIQETKVNDEDFPRDDISDVGYHSVFKGEKSYNGVAILTTEPAVDSGSGFDGNGDDEGSRLIWIRHRGVFIINTYVPQGTSPDSERFQYKLQWFARLRRYFEDNFDRNSPIIWLGDFNVAPDPLDVHNPKRLLGHVGYHPDEHIALGKVKEWGFVDVFRKFTQEGGYYTFWDYRVKDSVERGLGWRVDHIWATSSMAESARDCWIDTAPRKWEKPSDHTPIVAVFKS